MLFLIIHYKISNRKCDITTEKSNKSMLQLLPHYCCCCTLKKKCPKNAFHCITIVTKWPNQIYAVHNNKKIFALKPKRLTWYRSIGSNSVLFIKELS